MKTAVEYLVGYITSDGGFDLQAVIDQAKEMHKQEIMYAHESGVDSVEHGYGLDYYKETFKSE